LVARRIKRLAEGGRFDGLAFGTELGRETAFFDAINVLIIGIGHFPLSPCHDASLMRLEEYDI
jgi:hypothetical protein